LLHKQAFGLLLQLELEGVGEGVTYPAMHGLLGKWVPPQERTRLCTTSYSGAYLGTIIGIPVSSALCSSSFLGGWPSVFYLFGVLGILWFLVWIPFVSNEPALDPTISTYERDYIESSLALSTADDIENKPKSVPWGKILTNLPFWALIINHTCNNWAFYTLLTWMPAYILHILKFDMSSSGIISVLPYIGFTVTWVGGGQVADYMIAHWWSTTTVRKFFQVSGFALGGACLIITGHIKSVVPAVAMLTASMTFMGLVGSGFANNHLDIGAQYSGILMGITNTAATIPGIVSPVLTGWILGDTPDLHNWQNVFYISGGVFGFGIVVWLIFASGKRQF